MDAYDHMYDLITLTLAMEPDGCITRHLYMMKEYISFAFAKKRIVYFYIASEDETMASTYQQKMMMNLKPLLMHLKYWTIEFDR